MARVLVFLALVLPCLSRAEARVDISFPSCDNRVVRNAVCVYRDTLYVGGDFTVFGGLPRSHAAAIDLNTGQVLAWDPQAGGGNVSAITAINGRIYLGGGFKSINGKKFRGLAAVEAGTGKLVETWKPDPDGPVAALAGGPAGGVFVAGRFENIAGAPRKGLGFLNNAEQGPAVASPFDPSPDSRVTSLVWDPSLPHAVLAGGFFSRIQEQERGLLALLDSATGKPLENRVEIKGGKSKEILRMILHRGVVYCAGVEIDSVDGQPHKNAFAVDPKSFALKPWQADLDLGAGALTAAGDYIYIGGDFRHANLEPRRVAAFHWISGELSDWDPEPGNNTYAAAAWGNSVFISGYWRDLAGCANADFCARVFDTAQPGPGSLLLSLLSR